MSQQTSSAFHVPDLCPRGHMGMLKGTCKETVLGNRMSSGKEVADGISQRETARLLAQQMRLNGKIFMLCIAEQCCLHHAIPVYQYTFMLLTSFLVPSRTWSNPRPGMAAHPQSSPAWDLPFQNSLREDAQEAWDSLACCKAWSLCCMDCSSRYITPSNDMLPLQGKCQWHGFPEQMADQLRS